MVAKKYDRELGIRTTGLRNGRTKATTTVMRRPYQALETLFQSYI